MKKSFVPLMILILLPASANSEDAIERVTQFREVIRMMFEEGSLEAESRVDELCLQPCSDGSVGLSQVFHAYDYSEAHSRSNRLDQSTALEVRTYFERFVAYQVELARYQATRSGYPAAAIDEVIDEIVVSALTGPSYPMGAWDDGVIGYDALLAALRNYRSTHPDLPEPRRGEGCGGGGLFAVIQPDPPDARVWLISEFDYRLCKLHGHNPKDMESCRWREETGTVFSVVGGNYRLYAKWRDGRTVFSRRNILHPQNEDSSENSRSGSFVLPSGEEVYADIVVYVRP